jgi:hypothetical protein
VEEFRVKAHDGLRLTGLQAKRSLELKGSGIRLRLVPPGGPPEIDQRAVAGGVIEYALQFPIGRRLEDRVLDVVRICQLAAAKHSVEPREVQLYSPPGEPKPDEFLIATELLAAAVEAQ